MKTPKIISMILLVLINCNILQAQQLINNGAKIVQGTNSIFVIKGNFLNQLNGNIVNSGIINITGNWVNNGTGNLMMGSTGYVQFLGQSNQVIGGMSPTWFPSLNIYQSPGKVALETDIFTSGITEVSGREFWLHGHTLNAGSHVLVTNAGIITVDSGAVVLMSDDKFFTVFSGGHARFLGTETSPSQVKCPAGYYEFQVLNGGNIVGIHTIFQNMDIYGIQIMGNVDPTLSLHNCTFREGEPDGTLITFNNPIPVTINNAHFPANTWSGNFNVTKLNDDGKVTFDGAYGDFAGETYENDPMNAVDWINTVTVHHLSLEQGWSGLSSWLIPSEPDPELIFYPIYNQLVLVMNFNGMYFPSQGINTLGNWESHDAFMIKMQEAAELSLTGIAETNYSVQLNEGWTLMPVVSLCPVSSDELFSGTGGAFEIAKEVAGTKVFWPALGIYTLNELQPGISYLVRSTDPIPLLFPQPDCKDYTVKVHPGNPESPNPWNRVTTTNLSHIIGVRGKACTQADEGDFIGVFTGEGICAGVAAIPGSGEAFSLTAFGDDPFTTQKEGFKADEEMHFKLLRTEVNDEVGFRVNYDPGYNNFSGRFSPDGISVVTGLADETSFSSGAGFEDIAIIPNPSTGKFRVQGIKGFVTLMVTDLRGKPLMKLEYQQENPYIDIDMSTYPKGLYLLNVTGERCTTIRKIVIG